MSVLSNRLVFSGHQSFPLRYSWMPKVAKELALDPKLFHCEDALVRLGVGKNMVNAIEFWASAMEFISGTADRHELTPLANQLLSEGGLDPYLETSASLWLLQWQLTRRPDRASTWHYAFTRWNRPVFTREELTAWLLSIVRQTGSSRASKASLQRDVQVFLRSYVPHQEKGRRPVEDSFDCPLAELGLIVEIEDNLFAFARGAQPTLSPAIVGFAILDYWLLNETSQETLSFERILHGQGSPGGAFQLSEFALVEILEQLPRNSGLRYDESAGMRRVVLERPPTFIGALKVLESAFVAAKGVA
jgi:hypothetical protein